MKVNARISILAFGITAALVCGCNTTKSHQILSFFFDGVPEPGKSPVKPGAKTGRKGAGAGAEPASKYREHGPYAAKECGSCHKKATSSLVMPIDELCFQCHSIDVRKRFLHGPLATGGCKVCHAPHVSMHPFLLISEPKEFCLHCHDRDAIVASDAHKGVEAQCTTCHDAHSSDSAYLLK